MPTPNRWRVVVPVANPKAKYKGLAALGISKPWAIPWQKPNIPTNIKVIKTVSFPCTAIPKPRRITDNIIC